MFDLHDFLKKIRENEEPVIVRLKSPSSRILFGIILDITEEFFILKSYDIGDELWEYAIPYHNVSYVKIKGRSGIKTPTEYDDILSEGQFIDMDEDEDEEL